MLESSSNVLASANNRTLQGEKMKDLTTDFENEITSEYLAARNEMDYQDPDTVNRNARLAIDLMEHDFPLSLPMLDEDIILPAPTDDWRDEDGDYHVSTRSDVIDDRLVIVETETFRGCNILSLETLTTILGPEDDDIVITLAEADELDAMKDIVIEEGDIISESTASYEL